MYVRNFESKLRFEGLPVRWSFQSSSVNFKTGPDVSFADSNGYVNNVIGESLLSLSVTIFFTHLSPGWNEIKLRACVWEAADMAPSLSARHKCANALPCVCVTLAAVSSSVLFAGVFVSEIWGWRS